MRLSSLEICKTEALLLKKYMDFSFKNIERNVKSVRNIPA